MALFLLIKMPTFLFLEKRKRNKLWLEPVYYHHHQRDHQTRVLTLSWERIALVSAVRPFAPPEWDSRWKGFIHSKWQLHWTMAHWAAHCRCWCHVQRLLLLLLGANQCKSCNSALAAIWLALLQVKQKLNGGQQWKWASALRWYQGERECKAAWQVPAAAR